MWERSLRLSMSPSKIFVWFETKSMCMVDKFSQALLHFGMKKYTSDHSIFYWQSDKGIILLVVYVDVIVIIGNDAFDILSLKTFL